MINEEITSEKMKYIINMNNDRKYFDIMDVYMDFSYTGSDKEELNSYDIDIRFDYYAFLDAQFDSFLNDLGVMQNRMRDILNLYVISQDGKLVQGGKNSNCFSVDPIVYNITLEYDTKHIFFLGYKFIYED